ncbi:MAG: RNA polymerase factor sigma-32 [Deltaproteobacteria bacterium]|nr:RNA polymerase factor sigma-32 [Deltaproteobacteria bacterium]MCB9488604.1 RNA polymerase factor sigma-32 [Deltaproteobacteria bacterium]
MAKRKQSAAAENDKSSGAKSAKDRVPSDEFDGDEDVVEAELVEDEEDDAEPDGEEFAEDGEIVDDEDGDDDSPSMPGGVNTGSSSSGPTTALTPVSGLSAYLSEIGQYPLLTREEEHDLAVRLVQDGDQEAAAQLVTSNLRLVVKIAMEFQRNFMNVMDLIQEGNIGLMQAVAKFDPFKGTKLSTYAAWWIKAYILRYILNNWRMVKIGTTQAQRKLFFNLRKEKEKLEQQGFVPTTKLLAERLDVPEKDVVEMDQRLARSDLSFDMPLADDSNTTLGDLTPDEALLQDEQLADRQIEGIVHEALEEFQERLTDKELEIYQRRMLGDPPATLQEIGDDFGVTRERVRQIESRVLKKLRAFFEEKGIESPY